MSQCGRRLAGIFLGPSPSAIKAWNALGGSGSIRPVKEAIPQFIGPNVEIKSVLNLEYLICKYCNGSWFVQKLEQSQSAEQPGKRLRQHYAAMRALRADPSVKVDISNGQVVSIRETTRTEETIGEERRIFDQSKTTASAVETIGLSHTAGWAVTLDTTRARTTGGNAQLSLVGFASVRGSIDASLSRRYSARWKQSTSRQQSTAVTIPAGKRVRVTVRWKRIWQEGEVTLRSPTGAGVTLPFRVTVMLGFDKETVDLK